MTAGTWNQRWKLLAIGTVFAIASVLETGLVVAQWTATDNDQQIAEVAQGLGGPGPGR